MFNEFPRVAIIGDTGDGKTTTMTALAVLYHQQGLKIFSNYELKNIEYTYLDPADMVKMMYDDESPLSDCIILTDEAHMDIGKYNFFKKSVRELGDFATQTRKRRIIWLYTTQVFTKLVKDLRDLTTNLIYCSRLGNDYYKLEIYDRSINKNGYLKTLPLNGKPFYKYFDTSEVIKKTLNE